MTPVEAQDPYAAFRAELAGDDIPTDVVMCAYRFAQQDLTKLADEEEALIRENRARVRSILARAVADAKSMSPENREFMVSMILADVTG